jgi:N-acetylglucosamine kinase-like BadF-type ATPase
MSTGDLIIGVDGGGTKTVAWLAPLDGASGKVLGRGQAGPGNPRAAGFEVAQANIETAIVAAFADAKLPQVTAEGACFGLAGAGRQAEQERIAAWAKGRGIAKRVKVTGDAELILAAASADNFGIALICGTGSLAWGRNREGITARCGGWGYLLGDEGSAYAIARSGLQAAVRAADGRGDSTALVDAFQQELNVASPEQLVEAIYTPEMTRERLAGLAKVVFDRAGDDPVAEEIVGDAAAELALMVEVIRRRLQFPGGSFPLALSGGVLLQQPLLREKLLDLLARDGTGPGEVALVTDPVRGALAIARSLSS